MRGFHPASSIFLRQRDFRVVASPAGDARRASVDRARGHNATRIPPADRPRARRPHAAVFEARARRPASNLRVTAPRRGRRSTPSREGRGRGFCVGRVGADPSERRRWRPRANPSGSSSGTSARCSASERPAKRCKMVRARVRPKAVPPRLPREEPDQHAVASRVSLRPRSDRRADFSDPPSLAADIISAVEFDKSGEQLATGDRGGRVVLFERVHPSKASVEAMRRDHGDDGSPFVPPVEYRYLTEFQSHEPEFDYLKSLEIEEKINTLRWCHQGANSSRFIISTNDKTIKLWKVFEKQLQCVSDFNLDAHAKRAGGAVHALGPNTPGKSPGSSANGSFGGDLRIPSVASTDVVFSARTRRTFGNAHAYHINSLSVNSDCETYISADDLRVNLWHLESSSNSFNIVDIKPENMEDLTEVITSAEFHPLKCNLFAYSSSKGSVRLADMRANALCRALQDVRRGGVPGRAVLLQRDHRVHLRRQVLGRRAIHPLPRLPHRQALGHQHGTRAGGHVQGPRSPTIETVRPVRVRRHLRQVSVLHLGRRGVASADRRSTDG